MMQAPDADDDEPTNIVPATAAATASVSDLAAGDDSSSRAWFDDRLQNFLDAMARDPSGRPRSDVERRALASAARDMIERLGWGSASPVAMPDNAALLPDQLVANTYYIRGLIARGGIGEVYRARHRDLRTDHAIKILLPKHTLNTTFTTMMFDEARLLQRVRHDGVVTCQGLLRDTDGRLLLVMEYLRGRTLSDRLQDGPLSQTELTDLTQRLAAALAALHGQKIIHQDLSPTNIILRDDSCRLATIIDFGLARSLTDPEDTHMLVDFAGKYAFVSPEQLGMGTGAVDARSDLYSLGLVIAAAATGQRLDMGHDADTARQARLAVPPLTTMPAGVAAVLARLLVPDPAKRLQSANDVIAAWNETFRRGDGFFGKLFTRLNRTAAP